MAQEVSVAPVLEGTKGSNPTTYTLFVRYWTVQLKSQYPEYKTRQQAYIQMWKALSPEEKKSWVSPAGDAPAVAIVATHRRKTGYQLFLNQLKFNPEMLPNMGPRGPKKLGEMWQALKGVPEGGQDYWNMMAKEDDV